MYSKIAFLVTAGIVFGCTAAPAQNTNEVMKLFGGIVQAAQVQAAQAEWRRVPQLELMCIDNALQQRGQNTDDFIQQGVLPSDNRLAVIRKSCQQSPAQLSSNGSSYHYVTNTRPPDAYLSLRTEPTSRRGQRVVTMPNGTLLQVLQRRNDGWWLVKVVPTGEQGWALSGQGGVAWIACCATAKVDVAEKPLQRVRKFEPSFECSKAKTAREVAICGNDELAELDLQYGAYWKQARPFDKSGTAKKEIDKRYRIGEACGAAVDCIRSNAISGIDYLAAFLKGNGVHVASYSDAKETKRLEAEQEEKLLAEQQQAAAQKAKEERLRLQLAQLEQQRADEEKRRIAQQQAEERRRIQREDDEHRLALARAEAEKAKAEAEKAKAEAERAKAEAQIRANKSAAETNPNESDRRREAGSQPVGEARSAGTTQSPAPDANKNLASDTEDDGKMPTNSKEVIVRVLEANGYSLVASPADLACRDSVVLYFCHKRGLAYPYTRITVAFNPTRIGIQRPYSTTWSDCFVSSSVGYIRSEDPQKCGPYGYSR